MLISKGKKEIENTDYIIHTKKNKNKNKLSAFLYKDAVNIWFPDIKR